MGQVYSIINRKFTEANKINLATYRQQLINDLTSGNIKVDDAYYYMNNINIDSRGKIFETIKKWYIDTQTL